MNIQEQITIIDGPTFSLEPFSLKLVTEEYVSWLRDAKVNRYLIKPNSAITIEQTRNYCEEMLISENDLFFSILFKKNRRHIGNVRIGPIDFDSKVCRFSMMIGDHRCHNQGIGTDIVAKCIDYCFYDLNMKKFFLQVIDENKAAVRIYEKNGLRKEGLLKNHILCHGKPANLLIMSRLKEDN
jgi:RimJ/RimL family protein N-acetyltransferase